MTDWTIPVKCSVVRSFDSKIRRLNWNLFKIYCIVAVVHFIYFFTGGRSSLIANDQFAGFYLLAYAVALSVVIVVGTVSTLEFVLGLIKAISIRIPNIKCIED